MPRPDTSPSPLRDGDGSFALRTLVPLAREFNTLKRVHAAGREGSWAARAFTRAWRAIVNGDAPSTVATHELAAAVIATRLGAIDAEFLDGESMTDASGAEVLRRGWAAATAGLPAALLPPDLDAGTLLRRAHADRIGDRQAVPTFVAGLRDQPRAGPTRPGTARLMLVPMESHAEHCWAVAVTGAWLAPVYGADPARVFLAGLAHHLPNAWLPDAGDAADVALGDALGTLPAAFRDRALADLEPALQAVVVDALGIPPDTTSPDAHAFHAADALDRVLEMEWFARTAAFTLDTALGEGAGQFDVLHPGPNQGVEREALRAAGLYA